MLTSALFAVAFPAHGQNPEAEDNGGWEEIGSFKGAKGGGFLDKLNDWIFEQERDTSLYQDLGALKLGLGYGKGGFDADWDNYFQRRVVVSHPALEPGTPLHAEDRSGYREVKHAITRVRFAYDYLPDAIGPFSLAVEVEGGFVLATAKLVEPRTYREEPTTRFVRGPAKKELQEFFSEHQLDRHSDLLDATAVGVGAVADQLAGAIGSGMADTEKGAIFFEDYADPIALFFDMGVPAQAEMFTSDNPVYAPGDTVAYTTFLGLSPLRAGFREVGVLVSFRRFFRFLRETIIQELPDDEVLVRVRNSASRGGERIPIRFRPEIRLLILKIGYTFVEARSNRFTENESDITFRIDLKSERGMEAFRRLLGESDAVSLRPALEAVLDRDGVEVVRWETRRGRKAEGKVDVDLLDFLDYRNKSLASNQEIESEQGKKREVVRARTREYRKPFGRKRNFKFRSVITSEGDLRARVDDESPASVPTFSESLQERHSATTIATSVRSRYASEKDVQLLASNVTTILGLEEPHPVLSPLSVLAVDGSTRLSLQLSLSFGWEQLQSLADVTESELWRALAELLLGTRYSEAWSTAQRRNWWMPQERNHGRLPPWKRYIGEYYDEHRGYRRAKREATMAFDRDRHSSRALFIKASKLAGSFKSLQKFVETGDCLKCVTDLYAAAGEMVLLQSLLVRFAGGVETGGVGYTFEIFTDAMPQPYRETNGIVYSYRYKRGAELVTSAETLRDSASRLQAGRIFWNPNLVAEEAEESEEGLLMEEPLESKPSGEGCWKMRIYSNLLFSDDLDLWMSVRKGRLGADVPLRAGLIDLGRPQSLEQTPFSPALFFYEIPLPWIEGLIPGETYTVLLRIVNDEGLPVTEEQEARLSLPMEWGELSSEVCSVGAVKAANLRILGEDEQEQRVHGW